MPKHFNVGDRVYVLQGAHNYDGYSGYGTVLRRDVDDYLVELGNREVWFHRQRLMPPRKKQASSA